MLSRWDIFLASDLETLNIDNTKIYAWGIAANERNYNLIFENKVIKEWIISKSKFIKITIKRELNFLSNRIENFYYIRGLKDKHYVNLIFLILHNYKNKFTINYLFQNGANFDFKFILYVYSKYYYKFTKYNFHAETQEIENFLDETYNIFSNQIELNYAINDAKKIFYMNFKYGECKIIFYDINLLIKGSLKNKAQQVNLNKLVKLEGYKRTTFFKNIDCFCNYKNEDDYLFYDCFTLLQFSKAYVNEIIKQFNHQVIGYTSSSTAWNVWKNKFFTKKVIDELIVKNIIKIIKTGMIFYKIVDRKSYDNFLNIKSKTDGIYHNRLTAIIMHKFFSNQFLKTKADYQILFEHYLGGIIHINDKHKKSINFNPNFNQKIVSYDINSHYPACMDSNYNAPYGAPVKNINIIDKNYYQFFVCKFKKYINKSNHFPLVFEMQNNLRSWVTYIKPDYEYFFDTHSLNYFVKIFFNNNWQDFYKNTEIKIIYSFKTKPFNYFFSEYINYYFDKKYNARNQMERADAKVKQNGLYGVFGTKKYRTSFYYDYVTNCYIEFESISNKGYLPMAIAITSLARLKLQKLINFFYYLTVYTDTDSWKFLLPKNQRQAEALLLAINIPVDSKKLGYLKNEYSGDLWIFRRAKQYYIFNTELNSCYHAHAGINWLNEFQSENESSLLYDFFINQNNLENLITGMSLHHQTNANHFVGYGIKINQIIKDIKPVWDFPPYLQQKIITKTDYLHFLQIKV